MKRFNIFKPTTKPTNTFRGPPDEGPRLIRRGTQGDSQGRSYVQCNTEEIRKIIRAVRTWEERIADSRVKRDEASAGFRSLIEQARSTQGALAPSLITRLNAARKKRSRASARYDNCKLRRNFTFKKARLYLDYALEHTPYKFIKCKDCKAAGCEKCDGGTIKKEKKSHQVRLAVEALKHLDKNLHTMELCWKVRAGGHEQSEAFNELFESENAQMLVNKFGNPTKTAIEHEDAKQGALIGVHKAATKYDPTEPKAHVCSRCDYKEKIEGEIIRSKPCPNCGLKVMTPMGSSASFRTYAHSWCYRETRARSKSQERPGLMPSINDPGIGSEGAGIADQIAKVDGRPQVMPDNPGSDGCPSSDLKRDLTAQIAELKDDTQRQVVTMLLGGSTIREITDALGISRGKVVKAQSAAFDTLRNKLSDYSEAI